MYDLNTTAYWRKAKAVVLAVFFFGACEGCEPTIVEPEYDACPNLEGIQPSVPSGMMKDERGWCIPKPPEYSLSVYIHAPYPGAAFWEGQSIYCLVEVREENAPEGSRAVLTLTLGSLPVECRELEPGRAKELVTLGEPARAVSGVTTRGEHILRARVVNGANGASHEISQPLWIKERVGQLIYRTFEYDGSAEVFVINNDGTGGAKQLTHNKVMKNAPMLSPDGKTLLYWDYPTGANCGRFLMSNPDGSEARVLMQGVEMPFYSPDGTKIAFVGNLCNPAFHGNYRAWVMNADGSGLKQLLVMKNQYEYEVSVVPFIAWMPSGEEVVTGFDEVLLEPGRPDVWRKVIVRVNILTDSVTRIYEEDTSRREGWMGGRTLLFLHDVTPDGEWAVISTANFPESDNPGRIALLRTDGSREIRWLTAEGGGDDWPSPCGPDFMFICYRPGSDMRTLRWVSREGKEDREIFRHEGVERIVAIRRWAWQKVWF